MTFTEKIKSRILSISYDMEYWSDYDFSILNVISCKKKAGRGGNNTYNNVVIMGDTETSKKVDSKDNHVVAWTISLRSYKHNICTLYGARPCEMIRCIESMINAMSGMETYIYFHNLPYDWVFLRKFMINAWGKPTKQLNVKSHYPIYIMFDNGVVLKDSLILAQKSLDRWSKDMNVEHQKACGKWNYDILRNQDAEFTPGELEYIEHDTLAGVECLEATMDKLNKRIYSIPLTATGIVREVVRITGKANRARDNYKKQCFNTLDELRFAESVYHGGYTHGNRHYLGRKITAINEGVVRCFDFASSYPYIMCCFPVPMGRFMEYKNMTVEECIKLSAEYAIMLNLILINPRIKSEDVAMPVLQVSKAQKIIEGIYDNGRVLCADYVSINICEIDLRLIISQYDFDMAICNDVRIAKKNLLPKWYRDYVYQCFIDKTMLKGGDPVEYALAKSRINSLYGLLVQHPIKDIINENYDTGEYEKDLSIDYEKEYEKYNKRANTILPYQHGIWITAWAMYNLFQLGECCDIWLYSDTDSCYGIGWDIEKVNAYNEGCIKRMHDAGYEPVKHNGRNYYLGVAEHEDRKDSYIEFKYMGAKRYCGRCLDDMQLHITVAGVPKSGASCLRDNIDNFCDGFVFSGLITGKKTHEYRYNNIYVDDRGNITGDSIDLYPCDYLLQKEPEIDWNAIESTDEYIIDYEGICNENQIL